MDRNENVIGKVPLRAFCIALAIIIIAAIVLSCIRWDALGLALIFFMLLQVIAIYTCIFSFVSLFILFLNRRERIQKLWRVIFALVLHGSYTIIMGIITYNQY